MKMTIYKVHGTVYNYVVAVCEENRTIYVMSEKGFLARVAGKAFEDVGLEYIRDECLVTEWPSLTFEEYAEENEYEADDVAWRVMKKEFVSEKGRASVLETWEDVEVW